MRQYLAINAVLAALIIGCAVVGCQTTSPAPVLVATGQLLTNSAPVMTAVSGGLATVPGGQGYSALAGAAAALASALGGFLVRHYATSSTSHNQVAPTIKKNRIK